MAIAAVRSQGQTSRTCKVRKGACCSKMKRRTLLCNRVPARGRVQAPAYACSSNSSSGAEDEAGKKEWLSERAHREAQEDTASRLFETAMEAIAANDADEAEAVVESAQAELSFSTDDEDDDTSAARGSEGAADGN